jgi:hypothetical protein
VAFELALPSTMNIHPVFHTSLLYVCLILAHCLLFMTCPSMKSSASWTWKQYGVRLISSSIGRVTPHKNGLGNLFATLPFVRSWSTPSWRVLFPNLFLYCFFFLFLTFFIYLHKRQKHKNTAKPLRNHQKQYKLQQNKQKKNDRNRPRHLFAVGPTGAVLVTSQV